MKEELKLGVQQLTPNVLLRNQPVLTPQKGLWSADNMPCWWPDDVLPWNCVGDWLPSGQRFSLNSHVTDTSTLYATLTAAGNRVSALPFVAQTVIHCLHVAAGLQSAVACVAPPSPELQAQLRQLHRVYWKSCTCTCTIATDGTHFLRCCTKCCAKTAAEDSVALAVDASVRDRVTEKFRDAFTNSTFVLSRKRGRQPGSADGEGNDDGSDDAPLFAAASQ